MPDGTAVGGAARLRRSARLQSVALLWRASRPLAVVLGAQVLLSALLPLAVLVAMGAVIGRIPAAARAGFGSAATDDLAGAVALLGAAILAAMLVQPAGDLLATTVRSRLTYATQSRLMVAVSRPVGIAHLEDPALHDRVAGARGVLAGFFGADAPVVLGRVTANRITWIAGCALIATFRWWLGLAILVLWQVVRRPLMRVIQEHVAAFGGQAAVMRRAQYFYELATGPGAASEMRVFGLRRWIIDRYRAHWAEGMAEVWRVRGGMSWTIVRIGLVLFATYAGACAIVARAAFDGAIDVDQVAVLLAVLFLTMTTGGISFDDITLEWQLAALPELAEVEDGVAAITAAPTGDQPVDGRPRRAIAFDGVCFTYPGQVEAVFDGLHLELPAGRSTAVVGANGAGKTTLVKLLTRMHEPLAGRLTVDGVGLDELDPRAWQRNVAVVFQDFVQLPLSLAENIGLGAHEHLDDRDGILEAAERAGAMDVIDRLPDMWSTPLSKQLAGGYEPSRGQWQRIALARALFSVRHGASVLVLDEPTASLDVRSEAAFFERFLDLTAGLTTLVISHRFSTVRLADQILVVRDGRVTEQGDHEELVRGGGQYARMFDLQASRFADGSGAR